MTVRNPTLKSGGFWEVRLDRQRCKKKARTLPETGLDLRFLSHDTGKCDASFPLYRQKLNRINGVKPVLLA
ncbi:MULTISPECIES: hypothetical protein [unclassified Microcoleus]|uniref:hypothetical protein n=1 Tax=unclassified Microcoleus TaxID=2642155 RepID=UPI002FD0615B